MIRQFHDLKKNIFGRFFPLAQNVRPFGGGYGGGSYGGGRARLTSRSCTCQAFFCTFGPMPITLEVLCTYLLEPSTVLRSV